jgi:hypothetical protein
MSASARDERLALNESIFRTANERMKAWEERHHGERSEVYYCECSDIDCREHVLLEAADYEQVRSEPTHFVVAVGHANGEVEEVIGRTNAYEVVEKDDRVMHVVAATDPRS